jgi:ABC-type branched-subunit amino acid transport system permease subunit
MTASVLGAAIVVALLVALVLGGPAVVLGPLIAVVLFVVAFALLRRSDRGRFRRRAGAPSSGEASYDPVQGPRAP